MKKLPVMRVLLVLVTIYLTSGCESMEFGVNDLETASSPQIVQTVTSATIPDAAIDHGFDDPTATNTPRLEPTVDSGSTASPTEPVVRTRESTPSITPGTAPDFAFIIAAVTQGDSLNTPNILLYHSASDLFTEIASEFPEHKVQLGSPQLSQNGEHVAVIATTGFSYQIWAYALNESEWQSIGQQFVRLDDQDLGRRSGLFPLGWSANERWFASMYTVNDVGQSVGITDLETNETWTIESPGVFWFSWAPDGNRFAYTDGEMFCIGDAITGEKVEISVKQTNVREFVWHPNSNLLAFKANEDDGPANELWLLDLETQSNQQLFVLDTYIQHVAFSETGEEIALISRDDFSASGNSTFVILDAETGEVLQQFSKRVGFANTLRWLGNFLLVESLYAFEAINIPTGSSYILFDVSARVPTGYDRAFIVDSWLQETGSIWP